MKKEKRKKNESFIPHFSYSCALFYWNFFFFAIGTDEYFVKGDGKFVMAAHFFLGGNIEKIYLLNRLKRFKKGWQIGWLNVSVVGFKSDGF